MAVTETETIQRHSSTESPVFDEKSDHSGKEAAAVVDLKPVTSGGDTDDEDKIIVTGADAANHLLSLRDDGQPALTFRGIVLASGLSAFQAAMSQIYSVSASYRCSCSPNTAHSLLLQSQKQLTPSAC